MWLRPAVHVGVYTYIHIHIYSYTCKYIPSNHIVSQVHGTTIAITITTTNQKKTSFVSSPPEVWRRTEYRIIHSKKEKEKKHSLIPCPRPFFPFFVPGDLLPHIHTTTPATTPNVQTSESIQRTHPHTHTPTHGPIPLFSYQIKPSQLTLLSSPFPTSPIPNPYLTSSLPLSSPSPDRQRNKERPTLIVTRSQDRTPI